MKVRLNVMNLSLCTTTRPTPSELRFPFATHSTKHPLPSPSADRLISRYPPAQYKTIDGAPMVIGINDGAEVLKQIYDKYDEIKLGEEVYEIVEKGISVKNQDFGLSDKFHSYEFSTPWLALNQENYLKYYWMKNYDETQEFMRRTLIGNLLSMSKTLNYQVPDKIKCDVSLNIRKMRLKDVNVMAFIGGFNVNFIIPDYLGIGKSVSRGFGAVRQLSSNGQGGTGCNS